MKKIFYINSPLDQFEIRNYISIDAPIKWCGKWLKWDKLSNSGNTLKLLIPNFIWKIISGWINYLCMVKSQKISEKRIGNRGSKLIYIVKEQRVNGSLCMNSKSLILIFK